MNPHAPTDDSNSQWFRQFWLWVAIALPASVVIAGFVTFGIVVRSPDPEVSDANIHEPVNDVLGRNSVAPPKR